MQVLQASREGHHHIGAVVPKRVITKPCYRDYLLGISKPYSRRDARASNAGREVEYRDVRLRIFFVKNMDALDMIQFGHGAIDRDV